MTGNAVQGAGGVSPALTRPLRLWGLLALLLLAQLPTRAEARDIYVRLSAAGSYTVASDGAMMLVDGGGKAHPLGNPAALRVAGGRLLAGKAAFALPVRITGGGLMRFNNRRYRGAFLITSRGLLNVLDLEDYLRGVLPAEVGASWPMEALRVQAIISRTYALRQSLARASRGYDVTDTVADQVYRGAGVETAATNQAVASTEREILTYGSELAFTPFHSDSGGHTANNADVWGRALPYLAGVPEPVAYASPNASWSVRIPRGSIEAALARIKAGVGVLSEVRVTHVDKGGRATALTFTGSRGTSSVKASQFRTAIGPNLLKSTMLTSRAGTPPAAPQPQPATPQESRPAPVDGRPLPPVPTSRDPMTFAQEKRLAQMTADGVFTTSELVDMLSNPNKKKGYFYIGLQRTGGSAPALQPARKPAPVVPIAPVTPVTRGGGFTVAREGDAFVFCGRGWGHGVGLSQWGSLTLAKNGWKGERILMHYYPGTEVKRYR